MGGLATPLQAQVIPKDRSWAVHGLFIRAQSWVQNFIAHLSWVQNERSVHLVHIPGGLPRKLFPAGARASWGCLREGINAESTKVAHPRYRFMILYQ